MTMFRCVAALVLSLSLGSGDSPAISVPSPSTNAVSLTAPSRDGFVNANTDIQDSIKPSGPTGTWQVEGGTPFRWEAVLRADGVHLLGAVSACSSTPGDLPLGIGRPD